MPIDVVPAPPTAAPVAQPAGLTAPPHGEPRSPWRRRLPLLLLGGVLAWVFGPIAASVLVDCWNDPNYSHGVLLPIVVAFLVRARRHDLVDVDAARARRDVTLAWAVIAAGCAAHVVGSAASESFTLRMSGVFLAVGLCGVVGGAAGWRRFAPALLLLAAAVPLPYVLYYRISFPMQLLSARLAASVLDFAGQDVVRSGNVFEIGGQALEVVGACSGIRSMMALSALAWVGGVWLRQGAMRTAALVVLALPVALAGNLLRLVVTALLVLRFGPGAAKGTVHEGVGLVCFALSALGLVLVLRGVRRMGRKPAPVAARREAGGWLLFAPRAAWIALGAIGLVATYGTWLRVHAATPGAAPQLESLPLAVGDYTGREVEIDARTREQLQADAFVFRSYAHPQLPSVGLYAGYYRDPGQGAQIHSPLHCYPGGGWKVLASEPIHVRDLKGQPTTLQRLVVRKQEREDVVIYWYETRAGQLTGDIALKLALMRAALLHRPQDVAFVRWSTPRIDGEDLEAGTRRLLHAVALATPGLEATLPFAR